jgi:hypothetical protein
MSLRSKAAKESGPDKNPSAPKSAGSARKPASPAFALAISLRTKPPTSIPSQTVISSYNRPLAAWSGSRPKDTYDWDRRPTARLCRKIETFLNTNAKTRLTKYHHSVPPIPKMTKGLTNGKSCPTKSNKMENGKSTTNTGNHIQLPSVWLSLITVATQRHMCRNGKTNRAGNRFFIAYRIISSGFSPALRH